MRGPVKNKEMAFFKTKGIAHKKKVLGERQHASCSTSLSLSVLIFKMGIMIKPICIVL